MRIVAIDQGTTSSRAFILNGTGRGEIVATRTHEQHYPHPGWVEHDPLELLRHVRECLSATGPVDAIGIGNQGESCLGWNRKTGEPISPVIVWQDTRSEAEIANLRQDGAEVLTKARAGLPLDSYFSASKLAWILRHIPEAKTLLARGDLCLGTTDAFFLQHLTGRAVTDITTASRTSLMNLETGQWDADLCRVFGVPIETLPEIMPTMGDFGAAEVDGRKIPVTASVVDQQAALFGHGCRDPGDAKITFGTGAFALALTGLALHHSPGHGLLPTVAWQQRNAAPSYALDGGVYCAASAINWGRSLGLFSDFTEIDRFEGPSAVSRDLTFVPALAGLGSPHWDRSAAGMWLGMSLDTTSRDLMQAMLEGIAFRTGEVMQAMAAEIDLGPTISIDGGLSANRYFCQFLADVLQKEIVPQTMTETTSLGVARMAAGLWEKPDPRQSHKKTYHPHREQTSGIRTFAKALGRSRGWLE